MRMISVVTSLVIGQLFFFATSSAAQSRNVGAPETFSANAHVTGGGGASAGTIRIHIERYTPEADRTAVESALKGGGFAAGFAALKKAPEVGYVEVGDRKVPIRWARQTDTGKGRTIVVVTDAPMFFIGGAKVDAKPRAGYDVALVQFQVDEVGLGSGTMAAAARIKPDGAGGVVVDDYADAPIKLVTVTRKIR